MENSTIELEPGTSVPISTLEKGPSRLWGLPQLWLPQMLEKIQEARLGT